MEEKLQQQEINFHQQHTDKLRHDMKQQFAVLTSQLQTRLTSLEQKPDISKVESKLNETKLELLSLQQKYLTLEYAHDILVNSTLHYSKVMQKLKVK